MGCEELNIRIRFRENAQEDTSVDEITIHLQYSFTLNLQYSFTQINHILF